jgi:hypothetical protein
MSAPITVAMLYDLVQCLHRGIGLIDDDHGHAMM